MIINTSMVYLKIILELVGTLKQIFQSISKYLSKKKKIEEVKKVEEFKKEVIKKVENGDKDDIDDLNKKLRF